MLQIIHIKGTGAETQKARSDNQTHEIATGTQMKKATFTEMAMLTEKATLTTRTN